MCRLGNRKHLRFAAACVTVAVFLAVGCKHTKAVTKKTLPYPPTAKVTEDTSEATLLVNSAFNKILRGDFASAREIVRESAIPDSKTLKQLRIIIDKYMAIMARRRALQNDIYQAQIEKLRKLHQKDLPEDINDISDVFEVVLKALEYADKEQKQALRKDSFVLQTVQKAKVKAAEFESKGRWLDA